MSEVISYQIVIDQESKVVGVACAVTLKPKIVVVVVLGASVKIT